MDNKKRPLPDVELAKAGQKRARHNHDDSIIVAVSFYVGFTWMSACSYNSSPNSANLDGGAIIGLYRSVVLSRVKWFFTSARKVVSRFSLGCSGG